MKIFVLGAGFAGIKAANTLSSKLASSHEIYLINREEYTTMLPNLPEVVSGRLDKLAITERVENLIDSSVKFLKEEVVSVSFDFKTIKTKNKEYCYDYLIFALGSKTNFYGFNQNLDKVKVLESIDSAELIRKTFLQHIEKREEVNLVISGAGFTGIELACNLYDICKKKNKKININFVEVGKKLLPMLSEKSASHVLSKLEKLKFKIYTENQITAFDGKNVTLKNGEKIEDAFFCWCSGVKSSLKPIGSYEELGDGRILVDEFLNIPKYPEVYVAGDSAAIKDKDGKFLRRGVNYSQMSGNQAAKNIALQIQGKDKKVFKPIDLGWVIPMYISSVGVAMGVEVRGRKGIFMHYLICGMKNYNLKNFFIELKAAIKYPFAKL
jgi:NADH dehydrogenase